MSNYNIGQNTVVKNDSAVVKDKQKEFVEYIIEKMVEADKNNQVFRAVFTSYSKGYYKDGRKTNHKTESLIKAKMTLKKPLNVLMQVIESPKDIARGSTLLYTGGDKVKIKAAGILGLIPVTFSINDPMFSDTRNHKILATIDGLYRLTETGTKVEMIGLTEINGKDTYMLKVIPKQKLDDEITHEIYGVDAESFIVTLNEMYVGDELVSQYKVENIQTNIQLDDDFFKL